MSKRIVQVVAGVSAVAALGVGGAWFVAAGKAVTALEQAIANISSKARPDGSTLTVTHEGLARTSFPAVGVKIINPALTLSLPAQGGRDAIKAVWGHEGSMVLITDYFAHEYRFVQDGISKGEIESGVQKLAIHSTPLQFSGRLKAKTSAAFSQWQALNFDDPIAVKKAVELVGEFEASAGAVSFSNVATGAVVASQQESLISVVNRGTEQQIDVDLTLRSKGAEVTKEYMATIVQFSALLKLPLPKASIMDMASAGGKQDAEIILRIHAPKQTQGPTPNAEIHADRFYIKNDFYTLNAPSHVVLKEQEPFRNASIKLDWSLEITPLAGQAFTQMRDVLLPHTEGMGEEASQEGSSLRQQQLEAALPNLSTLGPITFRVDVEGNMPTPEARRRGEKLSESLEIRALNLDHKRWGLNLTGKGSRGDAVPASLEGTLLCKKCSSFTQDTYETVRDAQALLPLEKTPWPLNDTMRSQLDATLAEIGQKDAATGDITFAITTPAPNDVRVNGKPVGEAMMKLMAVFAPVAPSPAVDAGENSVPQ